jgi:hypothetical protein
MKFCGVAVCAMLLLGASICPGQETGAEYIVTVTVAGSGSVVSTPPGIECAQAGGDCSAKFSAQTPVTLTPREEAQFTFQGWSNGSGSASQCPGTNGPCSFVLIADSAVSATFVPSPPQQPSDKGATPQLSCNRGIYDCKFGRSIDLTSQPR